MPEGRANNVRRVLGFYKFVELTDPVAVQEDLLDLGQKLQLKGTILLAREGINATVVGEPHALQALANMLEQRFGELTL